MAPHTEHYTHGSVQWTMYGRMNRPPHLLSVSTYLHASGQRQISKRFGAEEAHWAHNPRVGGSKLPIASRNLCLTLGNTREDNFANHYNSNANILSFQVYATASHVAKTTIHLYHHRVRLNIKRTIIAALVNVILLLVSKIVLPNITQGET